MVYFLIGTQFLKDNENHTWDQIKSQVFSGTLGDNAKGQIIKQDKREFKLGNMDSLMHHNDTLSKMEVNLLSLDSHRVLIKKG